MGRDEVDTILPHSARGHLEQAVGNVSAEHGNQHLALMFRQRVPDQPGGVVDSLSMYPDVQEADRLIAVSFHSVSLNLQACTPYYNFRPLDVTCNSHESIPAPQQPLDQPPPIRLQHRTPLLFDFLTLLPVLIPFIIPPTSLARDQVRASHLDRAYDGVRKIVLCTARRGYWAAGVTPFGL